MLVSEEIQGSSQGKGPDILSITHVRSAKLVEGVRNV